MTSRRCRNCGSATHTRRSCPHEITAPVSQAEINEIERVQVNVRSQKNRARNIADGLCAKARSHGPPLPGRTLCEVCTAKKAAFDHRHHIASRKQA